MISKPVDTTDDDGEELFPAAQQTFRVEWGRTDEIGQPLPPGETIARLVTPYGTLARRIRLRLSDESLG